VQHLAELERCVATPRSRRWRSISRRH
jgi:hypothetical protein